MPNDPIQQSPDTVGNFTWPEVQFYLAVLAIATLAGAMRALRDQQYQSAGNFLGVCGTAGFLGLSCVAFLARLWGGLVGNEFFHLGVAAFVGCIGKEADFMTRWILTAAFKKLGVDIREEMDDDATHHGNEDD